MLTANEARKFVFEYNNVENVILPEIYKKIEEKAKKGETSVTIFLGAIDKWSTLENTPDMLRVIDKLRSLGFKVSVECYGNSYVPRGLQDDDGSGPSYQNYGYVIEWSKDE